MAKQQPLSQPPILEALIDIRVTPKSEMTPEVFSSITHKLNETYIVKPQESISFRISGESSSVQVLPKEKLGERIEGNDREFVIQFQVSGFTFSRLKYYTSWENLVSETKNFWERYKTAAEPQKVTRIATRYINRVELPQPVGSLTRFLTAPPILPPHLPSTIAGFQTAVTVVDEPNNIAALFQQRMENAINPSSVAVYLDIDVFQQKDYEINDESFWETLNQMREFKNTVFFESITEETLNPYR
jgi:uncharacterized protein (TIGR04255 family)